MTEEEAVALADYQATLNELDSNDKIKINGLTMLADENKEYAHAIAVCIERQLKTVPKQCKLYVLYLIDSICKNFPKSTYVQLFTQNLVSNFCSVFEVSDEKTRRSLYKLRISWTKTKLFPQKKLNAIDKRVQSEMDPNWPILSKLTANNENPITAVAATSLDRQHQHMQNQHPPQQQQQQIQLQQSTQQQLHQQHFISPFEIPPQPMIVTPQQPQMMIFAPFAQPQPHNNQIPQITQSAQQTTQIIAPEYLMQPSQQTAQITVSEFLMPPQPATHANSQIAAPEPLMPLPTQQQQQPVKSTTLETLYGGKQCSNCSLRFDDNNKYAIHLDWHFRQNLKSDTNFARRKWYYPLNLWVQFREINDDDLQENNTDSNVNDLLLPVNENEVPTAPASKDDDKNICSVCHETFEKFWAEEEEEWRLKNAKLYEIDECVYHPLCLMDMLQANVSKSE